MLRRLVIRAFIFLSVTAAVAEPDKDSANYWLPFCRHVVAGNLGEGDPFFNGACVGIITGLVHVGRSVGVCPPNGVTLGQAASVVVQYLDQHPARTNENFEALAIEAMREAWPCSR
jgi:hypothetical protein